MASEQISLEGFKELNDALNKLGLAMGVKVLRKAGRQTMQSVESDMRAGARVDTGDLRDSIGIRTRKGGGKKKRYAVAISVGTTQRSVKETTSNAHGAQVTSKRKLDRVYSKALAQEYGNIRQTAKPFIRPALDKNKHAVLGTLKHELSKELKRVARAGKKR